MKFKRHVLLGAVLLAALVSAIAAAPVAAQDRPTCQRSDSDPDGDGWGWENNQSCKVESSQPGAGSSDRPTCQRSDSDPDGDGWGWENNRSCKVAAGQPIPVNGDRPTCQRSDSDPDGDGWGWENNRSCKVAADLPPSNPTAPAQGRSSTTTPIRGIAGPDCVGPNNNRNPPNMRFGDFMLMNNAWNAGASNGPWRQCTSLRTNANGSIAAQWNYDWLNEWQVNGPVWSVKSYPEVIYGTKSRGEVSADKATTGLPARYRDLDNYRIDFAYSSSQTTKRSKTVNGRTVYGEKNVAIETFFHSSCDIRRGSGGSNRVFEIMVWLDHGPERKPDGRSGYKRDVTIDGLRWEVWTKGAKDPGYIAFYAKNPMTSGSLDWNAFIDWARRNGQANGTRSFDDNWCMANILFGTEIWWGEGTFSLDYLRITR